MMNFSEYALFLKTYISKAKNNKEYFYELMQNFIDEDKWEEEDFESKKSSEKSNILSKYINNSRNIPRDLAKKIIQKCNVEQFATWLDDRIAESNSYEDIYNWLVENGIDDREVSTACANLLKDIIYELASKPKRNSKQEKTTCTAQSNNNSEYAKFINDTKLPSELDKKENIFSFRSNKIEFQGRKDELEKLNEWLVQGHVSVWAITGQGGSGKSRLALRFATQVEDDTEKESIGKAVWIDNEMLDKLLTFNDFSYPKPVLFICDYAANYEEKLSHVVDKISRTQANAKFLLIERSNSWYSGFLQKKDVVNEFAEENPILLDDLDFTSEEYSSIMQDFSDALYGKGKKKITNKAQLQIIKEAKRLSGKEHSARCLFLLLVTDAYLKASDMSHLSAQDLLHNYFDHSRKILSRQYEDGILKAGYRVLAYATACGGISFSDVKNHPAIQNEWNNIKEQLKNRSDFNQFFQRISEIDEKDTVPAMKPDLLGEFLFLHEWNELMDEQKDWMSNLLKQDYSCSFFAMCLSDWEEESRNLLEMLNSDFEKESTPLFMLILQKYVNEYRQGLVCFLKLFVEDIDIVLGLVDDAFFEIMKDNKILGERHFKTRLFVIGRTKVIKYLRMHPKFNKLPLESQKHLADEGNIDRNHIKKIEPKREVLMAILSQKPEYRMILYLFYYERFSSKEIAKIMKTTEKQLNNILKALRSELE